MATSKQPAPSPSVDSPPMTDMELLEKYAAIIESEDTTVTRKMGRMMSIEKGILFNQEGIFKYALTRTKHYFSFHNMVMYGHPTLKEELMLKVPKVKFQKGCINFKNSTDFPFETFRECVAQSATVDYLAIVAKYQKKKR